MRRPIAVIFGNIDKVIFLFQKYLNHRWIKMLASSFEKDVLGLLVGKSRFINPFTD